MESSLKDELVKLIEGEAVDDREVLEKYSEDKSIFKITPKIVVFPKNSEDIKRLVSFAKQKKLGLTCRAGGTDMSGGSVTEDILIIFTKYFNKIAIYPQEKYALVEPGVYFRDFEKELDKYNLMLPSYPASKEICALGGMVANDSGGEKSLKYGKTHNYVLDLKVVLSDGQEYWLSQYKGEFYKKVYELLKKNLEVIKKSKPKVTKNSSGYNIWEAFDGQNLDLTKIFVGSQGTLGIITEIKLKLVEKESCSKLLVIFTKNFNNLPQFTNEILKLQPTSLEITDDHTFKIFLKFAKEMASLLGAKGIFEMIKLFSPEIFMILKMRLKFPKLVILAEFTGNDENEVKDKISKAKSIAEKYNFFNREPRSDKETQKYWRLRRDTYRLLREKIKDRTAAPFIDDFIIPPDNLPEFLPALYKILDEHKLIYTVSGHLGDGNIHIIPLVDLKNEKERKQIPEIMEKVNDLVLKYNGLLTAEHNDGLIRGFYLKKEFGEDVFKIFKAIKDIFDPQDIFNPHKKVDADETYSLKYIRP